MKNGDTKTKIDATKRKNMGIKLQGNINCTGCGLVKTIEKGSKQTSKIKETK